MRMSHVLVAIFLLGAVLAIPACTGDTGPAGPAGNSGTATPPCSNPSSQGYTVSGPVTGSFSGSALQAGAVTIATSTATSISFFISSAPVTGQLRLGIYNDNGSAYPGTLVCQTNPQNMVGNAWNTISLPANTYLPGGVYWLAFNMSSGENITYASSGGNHYYVTLYGFATFPTTFPGSASNNGADMSIYVSTCP